MKHILLVILFFIGKEFSLAQAPNWAWAHSSGEFFNDVSNCVATDTNGNVFVIGYFDSPTITFGTITLVNHDTLGNSADIFIVKYDASGNVLWANSAGGIESEDGIGVSVDINGNVFITGGFQSPVIFFGNDTLFGSNNLFNDYDVFIFKYDAIGNELWAKSAGGINYDYATGLSTDAAGNVFIAGMFESPTISFDSTILNSGGFVTIFITKYDSSGNVLWAKSSGGTGI